MNNYDLLSYAGGWPEFLGVFSRDRLPARLLCGSGILNLDDSSGPGTHWTAWYGDTYFDSYGLPPPEEFLDKAGDAMIFYNDLEIQRFADPPFCGHLCLAFLEHARSGGEAVDFMTDLFRV